MKKRDFDFHEHRLVGCVQEPLDVWRELALDAPQSVKWVQSACACGWRSPRLRVRTAHFEPSSHGQGYIVLQDLQAEEQERFLRRLWSQHHEQADAAMVDWGDVFTSWLRRSGA